MIFVAVTALIIFGWFAFGTWMIAQSFRRGTTAITHNEYHNETGEHQALNEP